MEVKPASPRFAIIVISRLALSKTFYKSGGQEVLVRGGGLLNMVVSLEACGQV